MPALQGVVFSRRSRAGHRADRQCLARVQEMPALLGSKMPITEANAVIQRLTGGEISRVTLDREAKRQGGWAERKREKLDEEMQTAEGARALGQGSSGDPLRW